MESIKLEQANRFTGTQVEIKIHDRDGSDQAPKVRKPIKKVQLCPDRTHIRFYFDDFYFLAVPVDSDIQVSGNQWSAVDTASGLTYTIDKVQV